MSDVVFWGLWGLIAYAALIAFVLVVIDLVKHRTRRYNRARYRRSEAHVRTLTVKNDWEPDWDWPEDVGTDE